MKTEEKSDKCIKEVRVGTGKVVVPETYHDALMQLKPQIHHRTAFETMLFTSCIGLSVLGFLPEFTWIKMEKVGQPARKQGPPEGARP